MYVFAMVYSLDSEYWNNQYRKKSVKPGTKSRCSIESCTQSDVTDFRKHACSYMRFLKNSSLGAMNYGVMVAKRRTKYFLVLSFLLVFSSFSLNLK